MCERAYDRERRSAAKRGYDAVWRELRASFLARHPTCCVCGEAATEVDHIIPLRALGARLDEQSAAIMQTASFEEDTQREPERAADLLKPGGGSEIYNR
jgi:5-methylcytosine-specific restriction endonuclease McrA